MNKSTSASLRIVLFLALTFLLVAANVSPLWASTPLHPQPLKVDQPLDRPARSDTAQAPSYDATTQAGDAPIRLRAGTFVPARGESLDIPADLKITEIPDGQAGYFIVQFTGPILEEWKEQVVKAGGTVFDYIPDFAFIVYMDEATRLAVANMPEVVAIEFFHPAYKLNPELSDATGLVELVVQTFPNAAIGDVVTQSEALGGQVEDVSESEFGGQMRLTLDAAHLADLARVPGVRWIEPFYEPVLFNDVARSSTLMDAEAAWNDLGLYGAGQIVAVADTGLDTGNLSTLHQDFLGGPTSCSGTGRIVATYARGRSGDWSDSCRTGGVNDGGHGTHVAGSVLGNGCRSGSNGQPNYSGSYAGLAPQASLVMQSLMDSACGLGGIPTDLNQLFQQAYDAGARIHTNSWGARVAGQYIDDALNTDQFTWNHKDYTILFSAGNEGVDANPRDGYVDADSMGSGATAKNAITVGASENLRSSGGYNPGGACSTWGGCWSSNFLNEPIKSDRLSSNVNGMAAFSSRGPTDDGRIKPDVVAPGTNILSTKSQGTYVDSGWGAGPSQYYMYEGGTSMATPLTAGAVALIREFYTRIKGVTPSAALLKATLINSAVNMHPGQYTSPLEQQPQLPNNAQGWGRVNVANATDDTHQWQDISDANGLATSQSHTYTYPMCGTSPLKVTLVWSDYPGSTVASRQLVNDLDLTLIAPDGTSTYRGNVFSNGWSTTGGLLDNINNVESVYLQSPAAGNWTVTVSGHNVPTGNGGRQGYALVVDTPDNCFLVDATEESVGICIPADANYNVAVSNLGSFSSPVTLSASGQPAGTTISFSVNPVTAPGSSTMTVANTAAAAPGAYTMIVAGTAGAVTHQDSVTLNLSAGLATAPVLAAPANGSTGQSTTPTLTWNAVSGAITYDIQIASDPNFANIVASATGLTATSYTPASPLNADTVYYWRVKANNICGTQASTTFAFRTQGGTTCSNIILDGGFEGGSPNARWSVSSSTSGNAILYNNPSLAHTGSWFAWLGYYDNENSQVWQSTNIPPNASSATLSYWYRINSIDVCGPYDRGYLRINGTAIDTYYLCSTNNTSSYVQRTVNLTNSGSTEVRFQATTDSYFASSFLVEDVSLDVCTAATSTTADYSDLDSGYGVAWHTGNGTPRLGTQWTIDTSFGAEGDNASDDGVQLLSWSSTTGSANLTVTGANGYATGWIDLNQDGDFMDSGERIFTNELVTAGQTRQISWSMAGSTGNQTYSGRFRVYGMPQTSADTLLASASPMGGATDGEVEDYRLVVGPLAVDLASFVAVTGNNDVVVSWETVSEVDNLGFNLWRGLTPETPDRQLNTALIPSQAPGSSGGYAYTWTDSDALIAGQTYYYWLEAVDLANAVTRHGPVSVTFGSPTAVSLTDFGATAATPAALPLVSIIAALLCGLVVSRRYLR